MTCQILHVSSTFWNLVIMPKSLDRWNSGYRISPDLSLSESEASRCNLLDLGFSDQSLDENFNWRSIFESKCLHLLLASESLFSPGNYNIALRERNTSSLEAIFDSRLTAGSSQQCRPYAKSHENPLKIDHVQQNCSKLWSLRRDTQNFAAPPGA